VSRRPGSAARKRVNLRLRSVGRVVERRGRGDDEGFIKGRVDEGSEDVKELKLGATHCEGPGEGGGGGGVAHGNDGGGEAPVGRRVVVGEIGEGDAG
jgi:hypothetical protein